MHRRIFIPLVCLATALSDPTTQASDPARDHAAGCVSCTGDSCRACVPACTATWDEKKTKKTNYSMRCEYACVRGFDGWHAPPPECRCRPPCADVIVKKKLHKAEGKEKVERVPKYEVQMVPAEPCGCVACRHGHVAGWNPLGWLAGLLTW
ncbi:hypothetical protein EBR56_00735 [bacterium]|nr:hypothetical protein [bacterium]